MCVCVCVFPAKCLLPLLLHCRDPHGHALFFAWCMNCMNCRCARQAFETAEKTSPQVSGAVLPCFFIFILVFFILPGTCVDPGFC